jgi:hypothetical protein
MHLETVCCKLQHKFHLNLLDIANSYEVAINIGLGKSYLNYVYHCHSFQTLARHPCQTDVNISDLEFGNILLILGTSRLDFLNYVSPLHFKCSQSS